MYNIWNYLLLARRMAVISAPVKLVKLLKQCLKAQIQKNVAPICPPGPVRISVRCKLESWCHLSERGVVPGGGRGRRSVPDGHRGDARQGLGAWRPLASTQSERSCLLSHPPDPLKYREQKDTSDLNILSLNSLFQHYLKQLISS